MGLPQIVHNSKTINLPDVEFIECLPNPALRSILCGESGVTQTQRLPRMDTLVTVKWRVITPEQWAAAAVLKIQLENFRQWAMHGSAFTFALDSAKVVNATLTSSLAAGATVLPVSSATGIVQGQVYRLFAGPNYQIVTVSGISGTDITIDETLNFPFVSGAFFRDRWFFHGVFRDENRAAIVRDFPAVNYAGFEVAFSFFEAVA